MKPDWKDAPEWANWLAQDKDGHWYWFEKLPWLDGGFWVCDASRSRCAFSGYAERPRLPCEPRPEPQS
jgi:hypothetical protein